ncbi:hypothetical protein FJT64_003843 [Amphibalanus amphitrite]|uniref:Uncharacterized protein n=1 Tax=Amphibalanus amphitrite TaxID=1232801 RepID=A0A6A4VYU3_AMPAM|nr:hypothetical protein FJT64_003843 [Amphibalanus amphitrite]
MGADRGTVRRSLALVGALLLLLLGSLAALGGALVTGAAARTALLVAAGVHLVASSALTVGVASRRRPLLLAGLTWLAVLTAAALYASCSAWPGCGWHLAVALLALGYLLLTLAAVLRYYHSLQPTDGGDRQLPYSAMEETAAGTEMVLLTASGRAQTGESATDRLVAR